MDKYLKAVKAKQGRPSLSICRYMYSMNLRITIEGGYVCSSEAFGIVG
jgi:hypothetical protein